MNILKINTMKCYKISKDSISILMNKEDGKNRMNKKSNKAVWAVQHNDRLYVFVVSKFII
jgi:hypothetical protein